MPNCSLAKKRAIVLITVFISLPAACFADDRASPIDPWIGASVGGVIGSTIGQGDNRSVATAIGAVLGYKLAVDASHEMSSRQYRNFYKKCRSAVPSEYSRNDGTLAAWIKGCVDREIGMQIDLEQKAYDDGRNPSELR
jgi:uncharacterized protein YcfJ